MKVFKPGEAPENYSFEEYCPWCESMIPVIWGDSPEKEQYQFTCPECGHKLMICSACAYDDGFSHYCDWDPVTDTCKRSN